jgi:hypothetical protein
MESSNGLKKSSKALKQLAGVSRGITSFSKPSTAFGSVLPAISPTRGLIQGSRILTIESRKKSRRIARRPNQKEFDDLLKSYNEAQVQNHDLQNQNIRLQTLVLESKNELAVRTQQYKDLYERYDMLAHLEKWGEIIREKDREIHRLQEEIRKISTDRIELLNDKRTAEEVINGLKSRLRGKTREISDIKVAEKISYRAIILSETETLRNERDIAVGKLCHRDAIIEQMKLEVNSIQHESLQRKTSFQELQRRALIKEKQADDLRKANIVNKLKFAVNSNHNDCKNNLN